MKRNKLGQFIKRSRFSQTFITLVIGMAVGAVAISYNVEEKIDYVMAQEPVKERTHYEKLADNMIMAAEQVDQDKLALQEAGEMLERAHKLFEEHEAMLASSTASYNDSINNWNFAQEHGIK